MFSNTDIDLHWICENIEKKVYEILKILDKINLKVRQGMNK